MPLRRSPVVHDLLVALRAVSEDFPRGLAVETLLSPRIHWQGLGLEPPSAHRAEAWSREAKLLRGLEGWTEDLPEWAAETRIPPDATEEDRAELRERAADRRRRAERMGRCLSALVERIDPRRDRAWREHADGIERLLRDLFPDGGDGDPSRKALVEVVQDMKVLDALSENRAAVSFREVLQWLERAVEATEVPFEESDGGGIRILDAMQARGLTFERVYLVGLNERVFPRVAREDPFLDDEARALLSEATGKPLPLKGQGIDEEHLLLAMLLGSGRERVEVSWQRADDEGKSRTASLALREIARLVHGRPLLKHVLDSAARVPAHPEKWLETLGTDPGLLSEREERALIALRSAAPEDSLSVLGARSPQLRAGLGMLCATESFAPTSQEFDGRIGRAAARDHYGTTSLDDLGLCPLKYLFRRVLGIRELEEEATFQGIEARELGLQVHETLETLYRTLVDEGLFDDGDGLSAVERAREILPGAWDDATQSLGRRLGRHLPFLWSWYRATWLRALEAFVESDVAALIDGGWRIEGLEVPGADTLDFGKGRTATFSARFDRCLQDESGGRIDDYKSAGKLDKRGNVTEMLKGFRLQVPLYRLLSGGREVRLLGVGPEFQSSDTTGKKRLVTFDGFDNQIQHDGFRETMRVLLGLLDNGTFPLRSDSHCRYCAYDQACRRKHPPTLEREAHARDSSDYRLLSKKSKRDHPTLATLRREGGS